MKEHQPIADLGGDPVGDVGLHGGHVLLWVVHRDEQVAHLHGGVRVAAISLQVIVQLQPVEQRGRRGRTRWLHWRAVSQPRLLLGQREYVD